MLQKIFKRSVWAIVSLFFIILFTAFTIAQGAVVPYRRWIDRHFGVKRTFLVDDENADKSDTNYFPAKYAVKDENGDRIAENGTKTQQDALDVSHKVNKEGMVVLWNKDNALPLSKTTENKVATFGVHSVSHESEGKIIDKWIYHGLGSANVDLRQNVGMDASQGLNIGPRLHLSLENRNIGYSQKLVDATWNNMADKRNPNGYEAVTNGWKRTMVEVPWDTLQGDANAPIDDVTANYNQVAIYTIGRYTGEGKTVIDELNLTDNEKTVLQGLSDLRTAGTIKKVIVVLTFANAMNVNAFKDYNIDACVWMGYGGNMSTESLCDILWGDANPSGHLSDTWVYDAASAPASVNFGDVRYANAAGIDTDPGNGENSDATITYQEGIYVGYRYYETRYEDYVLGGGNASSSAGVVAGSGNWNYGDEVAYPFGYGTSYTTFAYSDFKAEKNGDDWKVSVNVKNTGSKAGKDAVQIYLQKPYTDYDKTTGIEKAAVELVGFAKTEEIAPNTTVPVTVTVPEYEFKTYDSYGHETYIVEEGKYYLAVGENAHDAVNNILAAKGHTPANTENRMDAAGKADFVKEIELSNDFATYSKGVDGYEITNRFDDADINLYKGTSDQKIKYLSRKDWGTTYPTKAVKLAANETIKAALKWVQPVIENEGDEIPTHDTESADGHLNLIHLMGKSYDDPLWDDLLDQLSYEDMIELLKGSQMPVASIAVPEGEVYDGPCGLRDAFAIGVRMAFPCAPIIASTFNEPLIEEMADAFAEIAFHHEFTGIWGISTNIHRLPYNGRNWEYFSEDGFLSGRMTAAETKGLTEKGIQVYTKHFVMNEMEINRNGINTWANEQTIREIYLKAFEAGITEGKGTGMMTSYNRLGTTWTGTHKGLLTDVLRGEWGFVGVTCTDWCERQYMGQKQPTIIANAVIAGQDEWIYDVVGDSLNGDKFKNNATFRIALRESAHRNLYTRLTTAAMNGVGSDTKVVTVLPAWEKAIHIVTIVAGVLMGVFLAMTAASWVLWYLGKKKSA